jgi:hypothetical protein
MVALLAENRRDRFPARAPSGTPSIRKNTLGVRMRQNAIWCTIPAEKIPLEFRLTRCCHLEITSCQHSLYSGRAMSASIV